MDTSGRMATFESFPSSDLPIIVIGAFVLLIILSELNFRFIEMPLRKYGIYRSLSFMNRK